MKLIARSPDEYLHRLLVEDEAAGSPHKLQAAAGAEGTAVYPAGKALNEGFPLPAKLQMYLIRKAGMYPDVCEALASGHLSRKDETSALVATEYYNRNNHFPNWARPYEFAADVLMQLGRKEEGRDMARAALRLPWWTLTKPWSEVAVQASFPGAAPDRVHWLLSDEATQAATAAVTGGNFQSPRTPQEVSYEASQRLLDLVAAGAQPSYVAVRDELAQHYRDAGLNPVADFVLTAE